nr:putative ribonuclease H-like domain-containing protein [Tanacetum cinerariifolium]
MELFGPTFVKSLSKKSYCLVVTDDYSRFSWVFFLATKDETASILKAFIVGLENLLSLKVKIIKCDNRTEFKNADLNQFCGLKGIKREFSVSKTPQQIGIAERKNRTLIEAARTLLADSLLPIPFWTEAVNTACYVQNRVLVTKPHNKTPYELLHDRLPSIRFMRPFGCPVTILNTLEPVGKFQGKVDEGFLVGYSVCSKAFRVFNSRTRIVQETLHVNFMENKPNVAGSGPAWLFDIDSLSQTMNYHPVLAENQTNFNAARKQGDKAVNKDKGKNPVVTITGFRDLNEEFAQCINNSSNGVSAAGLSISAAGLDFTNSTNDFTAAGPLVFAVELNFTNSTNDFSAAGPSNVVMPNLEDLSHNADDVGAEADTNNMESIISVSLIPTTGIHKDHPTSQIIGDLSSTTQTKSMARGVRDQDTECVVLSFDFKLPDENHVLLRVPRENNMYNVDLKNVVPSGDLTCFFAKAALDESNLWHRRLGHINFKTMNKLVKGNLVRGLPSKIFENNHTCVACKKSKQHRASCKSKPVSSVSHSLQRVSVTKPHNKTPYELLLGRTPSIGFMRPFGCHVTILNTLDPQGKFDGKADEEFLVGYSINSKAFRVFNSRARIVQETLHINFLENQPNVTGSGPKWLFDIDTLTLSMNYQPVVAENQPNHNAGIKENLNAGKVRKETVSAQQYVLLPLWSTGSKDPQNTDDAATFDVKENKSKVHVSPSSSDKLKKHDEKVKRADKGKSHVDLSIGVRDLRDEFKEFSFNSTNRVNAASAPDPSNYLDDPDMPALEDIVYSDDENVGAEADFFNLETNISFSPIRTTRVHKDHHVTQIIGDLTSAPQTRSMARMVEEQAFEKLMKDKFQMSSMGELTFFLGLQVKQKDDGIFISQDKHVAEILRKFGFTDVKSASTPIETKKPLLKDPDCEDVDVNIYRYLKGKPHLGLWYPKDSPFSLVEYSDSDYAEQALIRSLQQEVVNS